MWVGIGIGLVTSIVGSLIGLTLELHFDLAGKWEQHHIAKERRKDEAARILYERER